MNNAVTRFGLEKETNETSLNKSHLIYTNLSSQYLTSQDGCSNVSLFEANECSYRAKDSEECPNHNHAVTFPVGPHSLDAIIFIFVY